MTTKISIYKFSVVLTIAPLQKKCHACGTSRRESCKQKANVAIAGTPSKFVNRPHPRTFHLCLSRYMNIY